MEYQYRIARRRNDYFAHVRMKKFLFWGKWKKIIKRSGRYELIELTNLTYPNTQAKCENIIRGFAEWIKNEDKIIETYEYL